jgi:drug/metabolite transporter (DMT)-like permease
MNAPTNAVQAAPARARFAPQDIVLWATYLAFDTASQLAFKWAADAAGATALDLHWMQRALASPGLWIGIACYVGTLLVWLRVLARTELSRAFPMSGLAYITVPILAVLLFGESITFLEAAGIAAICVGVALLATERAAPAAPP